MLTMTLGAYDQRVATLQTQMNRAAAQKGWATVDITGGIGPKSIELFKKIQGTGWLPSIASIAPTRDAITANADTISGSINYLGNQSNWPQWSPPTPGVSPSPPATTPPRPTGTGPTVPDLTPVTPPPSATKWPYYLSGIIGGGAVLYAVFHYSKKSFSTKPALPEASSAW